jgi:PhnB protein
MAPSRSCRRRQCPLAPIRRGSPPPEQLTTTGGGRDIVLPPTACREERCLYRRALENGATSLREPTLEFYGDRVASFADRWGNEWFLATHVEDISEEEMARRAVEMANAGAQA